MSYVAAFESRIKAAEPEYIIESVNEISGYKKPQELNDAIFAGRYEIKEYVIEKYSIIGEMLDKNYRVVKN